MPRSSAVSPCKRCRLAGARIRRVKSMAQPLLGHVRRKGFSSTASSREPRVAPSGSVAVRGDARMVQHRNRRPPTGWPPTCSVERMGATGGFLLGIAFDSAVNCFACDLKHAAVFRRDASTGRMNRFAAVGIRAEPSSARREERLALRVGQRRRGTTAPVFSATISPPARRPVVPRSNVLRQRHGYAPDRAGAVRGRKRRGLRQLRADPAGTNRPGRDGRLSIEVRNASPTAWPSPRTAPCSYPATSPAASIAGAGIAGWKR